MIARGNSQIGVVVDLAKMQKLTEWDGINGVGEVDLCIHHLVHKLVLGMNGLQREYVDVSGLWIVEMRLAEGHRPGEFAIEFFVVVVIIIVIH